MFPLQRRLLQLTIGMVQEPPEQVGLVCMPDPQLLAPHGMLLATSQPVDPCVPLQVACLQLAASATHSSLTSVPEVSDTHAVPVALITEHASGQAKFAQRMPACAWTQKLLAHWLFVLHTLPLVSLAVHALALQ